MAIVIGVEKSNRPNPGQYSVLGEWDLIKIHERHNCLSYMRTV